jgi:hypothetical protein
MKMYVYRSVFRTILYEAIKQREKFEKEVWEYTEDAVHLAMMREMLVKIESGESTIHLRD